MAVSDIWKFAELTRRRHYFSDIVFFQVPNRNSEAWDLGDDIKDTFLLSPHEWLDGYDWRAVQGRYVFVYVAPGQEAIGRQLEALLPTGDPLRAFVYYEATGTVVQTKEQTYAL